MRDNFGQLPPVSTNHFHAVSGMSRFSVHRLVWIILLIAGSVLLGVFWLPGMQTAVKSTAHSKSAAVVPARPIFKETTDSSGLSFRHWCGDSGTYFVPESMGSGIALLDYDRDGDLDIFAVQGMPLAAAKVKPVASSGFSPTSRLYQQTRGQFTDVTAAAGLEDPAPFGMGAAVGDVNNDGWPDLFVSKYGSDRLYLNQAGKFEDITVSSGIDNPQWGTSACFTDYDRDGWLDLLVVNYYDYYPSRRSILPSGHEDYIGPTSFDSVPARLYRNLSGEGPKKQVRFRDVSFETGIGTKPGPALGILPADFNGDGWIDLYVANDGKANFLWLSRDGKTFDEEAIPNGAAYNAAGAPQASMGVTAGDVDGDGRPDLFMTHLEGEYSTLYRQVAPGIFEDRTAIAGLAAPTIPRTGFGTALADLDLDGDLDLVIANGKVRRNEHDAPAKGLENYWLPYAERNQIFLNSGHGTFNEIVGDQDSFIAQPHVTRGLAVGDIDEDGDLDLVTSEINGPARLFLNTAERKGSWLVVRAVDPRRGGRDAYGATVTVFIGERRWSRDINPAFSYLSSNDPRAHFGLGEATKYDRIEVLWPEGTKETFPGGAVNAVLTLHRGQGAQP